MRDGGGWLAGSHTCPLHPHLTQLHLTLMTPCLACEACNLPSFLRSQHLMRACMISPVCVVMEGQGGDQACLPGLPHLRRILRVHLPHLAEQTLHLCLHVQISIIHCTPIHRSLYVQERLCQNSLFHEVKKVKARASGASMAA